MRIAVIAGLLACGAAFTPAGAQKAPPLAVRHLLPIEAALEATRAAIAQCKADGYEIAVAVLDRDGGLRLLAASPNVSAISIELAQRKARSAAMFQISSGAFGERVKANPILGTAMQAVDPRLATAAGALPILVKSELIGAIGISGAPGGDKDEACAKAGLAAIAETLR